MANKVTIEIDGDNKGAVTAINGVDKKLIDMQRTITSNVNPLFHSLKYTIIGAFSVTAVANFTHEAVNLAGAWQGVNNTFKFLPQSNLLIERMRDVTKGTISELELMQLAIKSSNFKIPMDIFIKGLEFAKVRAQQTGESIDYMLNSFVTGTARESPKILDNLGISAKVLSAEVKKTGDFMTAVGNIVDKELSGMDRSLLTTVDKTAQLKVAFEELQTEIGKDLTASVDQGVSSLTLLLEQITGVDRALRDTTGQGILGAAIDGWMLQIGNVQHFYRKMHVQAGAQFKGVVDELKAERKYLENLMKPPESPLTDEQLALLKKQVEEAKRLSDQWDSIGQKLRLDINTFGLDPQQEKLMRLIAQVEEYHSKYDRIPGALSTINDYLLTQLFTITQLNQAKGLEQGPGVPSGEFGMSSVALTEAQRLHDQQIALSAELTGAELADYAIREAAQVNMFGNMSGAMLNFANTSKETNRTMFGWYKAFAMGQAGIDTYNAAIAAYKSMVGIPIVGPGLAIAAAAAATAFGLSNIARIASMQPGTSGGGGISASGVSIPSIRNDSYVTNNNGSKSIVVNVYGFVDKDLIARELIPSLEKAWSDGVGR